MDTELSNKLDRIETALNGIEKATSKMGVAHGSVSEESLSRLFGKNSNFKNLFKVENTDNTKGFSGLFDNVKNILEELKKLTGTSGLDEKTQKRVNLQQTRDINFTKFFALNQKEIAHNQQLMKKIMDGSASRNEIKEYRKLLQKHNDSKAILAGEKTAKGKLFSELGKEVAGGVGKAFGFSGVGGALGSLLGKAGPIGMAISALVAVAKRAFKAYAELDKSATAYARQVGGGATGQAQFKTRMNNFIGSRATWRNAYTYKEASESLTEYANNLGRDAIRLTNKSLDSLLMLKRFGIAAGTAAQFQQFGKSIYQTDKLFTSLYASTSKKGLAFDAVSKTMVSNLRMAQQYSFQSGLKGLSRMAEVSTQLRYNMQMVASFADKVSTLEGALQTSANLSALGGNYGIYGNPMQMLYESLNDVEALNKRMISMFSGSARWDKDKGEITIDPYERMRIKSAASMAGLDYAELTNMIMNRERESIVERQLRETGFGRGLLGSGRFNEVATYIKNLAEINEKGEAVISNLNGGAVAISSLTEENIEQLRNESENKSKIGAGTLKDVYATTMNIEEILKNIQSFLNTKLDYYLIRNLGGGKWGYDDIKKGAWGELVNSGDKPWEGKGFSQGEYRRRVQLGKEEIDQKYYDAYLEKKDRERKLAQKEQEGIFSASGYINRNGILRGNRHIDGGIHAIVEDGEAIIPSSSVSLYGVGMIDKIRRGTFNPVSNNLNVMKVSNGYSQVGNGNINLKSNPIQVDVNTNLNDLDIRFENYFDADKFAEDIYKRIEFKIKKGFDKENSPF